MREEWLREKKYFPPGLTASCEQSTREDHKHYINMATQMKGTRLVGWKGEEWADINLRWGPQLIFEELHESLHSCTWWVTIQEKKKTQFVADGKHRQVSSTTSPLLSVVSHPRRPSDMEWARHWQNLGTGVLHLKLVDVEHLLREIHIKESHDRTFCANSWCSGVWLQAKIVEKWLDKDPGLDKCTTDDSIACLIHDPLIFNLSLPLCTSLPVW